MADELLEVEGQDDVQLASRRQQRLGPKDVAAACKRAVGVSRRVAGDLGHNHPRRLVLGVGAEAALLAGGRDAVAAVVGDRGAGEGDQDPGVDAGEGADRPQLPAGGGEGAVVAVGRCRRPCEGRGRRCIVAEDEVGLCLGRGGVVGLLGAARDRRQDISG